MLSPSGHPDIPPFLDAKDSLIKTIASMKKVERDLLKTLRVVSGFSTTAGALAYIYKMRAAYPILDEDKQVAVASSPMRAERAAQFYATVALVDVLIDLQFQTRVSLQNIQTVLQ